MIPPSPSPSPSLTFLISVPPSTANKVLAHNSSPSKLPVDFSPPLIVMVVVIATAFLFVTYSRFISRMVIRPSVKYFRQWRRRRRRSYLASSLGDIESSASPYSFGFDHTSDGFHVFSPYGLDESVIKTIPISVYITSTDSGKVKKGLMMKEIRDCAVCLLEFEDNDYVRTLPICSHAFHVDCIDIWLRSHANCPLCRARIFQPDLSPFVPLMAARIRPSLDDGILESIFLEPLDDQTPEFEFESTVTEIVPAQPSPSPSPMRNYHSDDRNNRRDFLLKRSYSFVYERNFPSERSVIEPATASPLSPWRRGRRGGSFWNRRSSPFCSLSKHRVFSFRHYNRGINMNMKSPFCRRRNSTSLFPLSESSHDRFTYTAVNVAGGVGSGSRRSKSFTSPMFSTRSLISMSSSRLRCGDPEALLSPERFTNR